MDTVAPNISLNAISCSKNNFMYIKCTLCQKSSAGCPITRENLHLDEIGLQKVLCRECRKFSIVAAIYGLHQLQVN